MRAARRRFKWSGATYVQVVFFSETVLGAPHPFKAVLSGFAILRTTALHITRPTICLFFFTYKKILKSEILVQSSAVLDLSDLRVLSEAGV